MNLGATSLLAPGYSQVTMTALTVSILPSALFIAPAVMFAYFFIFRHGKQFIKFTKTQKQDHQHFYIGIFAHQNQQTGRRWHDSLRSRNTPGRTSITRLSNSRSASSRCLVTKICSPRWPSTRWLYFSCARFTSSSPSTFLKICHAIFDFDFHNWNMNILPTEIKGSKLFQIIIVFNFILIFVRRLMLNDFIIMHFLAMFTVSLLPICWSFMPLMNSRAYLTMPCA